MPVLGAFFATLFGSLASFFATTVTKKIALGGAAVATFAVLTLAFMAVIATSINTALSVAAPPAWFIVGFSAFMPSNFVSCTSMIIAARVAVALYKWNVENLRLLAQVT